MTFRLMDRPVSVFKTIITTAAFGAVIFLPGFVLAETLIPYHYEITGEETWSTVNSPYILEAHPYGHAEVVITNTGVLNIEPGVEIRAQANTYGAAKFYVYGSLNILGTEDSPVRATAFADDGTDNPPITGNDRWGGITFYTASVGNINYLEEKYTGHVGYQEVGGPGILNLGGDITINNSEFSHNYNAIQVKSGNLTADSILVDANSTGLEVYGGDVSLADSTISNSTSYGLYVVGTGHFFARGNLISNNKYNTALNVDVDFDIASTTFIGGNFGAWFLFGDVDGAKTLGVSDERFVFEILTINPGATLEIQNGNILKILDGGALINYGLFNVTGTKENPVYFVSIKDDSIGGDTNGDGGATVPSQVSHSGLFNYGGGEMNLDFVVVKHGGGQWPPYGRAAILNVGGNLNISNSEVSESFDAIYMNGGTANVADTKFRAGVNIYGGDFTVTNSQFLSSWGVSNYGQSIVLAENNWWNASSGPRHATLNPDGLGAYSVGGIDFDPWLSHDPDNPPPPPVPECCSSVLFLPGIKGSRLESDGDTLWPPTILSDDVRRLALNSAGESIFPVDVNGVLNTFYGTSVYDGFSDFMDELTTIDPTTGTSTIKEWLPLAYDWRYSPEQIIENGINTPLGTVGVLESIETLAEESYSGKVTIIAHSMGGLMGKAIIKALEEAGKADLIDAFVMVGTPQLGTPQAVGSLLHGDGEGIAGGFIVKRSESRMIGQNMKSAFNLLPSPAYFDEVTDPVLVFDEDSAFTNDWRQIWGSAINTYEGFNSFVTGLGFARVAPMEEDLLTPEVLRSDLMDYTKTFHDTYDSYSFPEHIRVVQVAGWGMPTVKGIKYVDEHGEAGYRALTTTEGDNTVVYPSGVSYSGHEIYFANLSIYNKDNSADFQHRNILSLLPVKEIVEAVVLQREVLDINYITTTKPPITEEQNRLVVSTHSPVIFGVYDELGNFTGINPNQDLSQDIFIITENIPGSSFLTFGESQYIFLPNSGIYSFVFEGIGTGPTTVEIEDFSNDISTLITSHTDIAVATGTVATFIVDSDMPEDTTVVIDFDGDGKEYTLSFPDHYTIEDFISILKDKIEALDIGMGPEKSLLNRVEVIEKQLDKANSGKGPEKQIESLVAEFIKFNNKGVISDSDKVEVISILGAIKELL